MKKIFAVALALVLTMAMFCASAETVTFSFAGVLDAEGNPYEGDTSELEGTVITIDDEANTIAITDADTTNGTIETEATEEGVAIVATMETGVELAFVYNVTEEGAKLLTLIQEENGLLVVFAAA